MAVRFLYLHKRTTHGQGQLYPTHSFKMTLKQNLKYDFLNYKKYKNSYQAEEEAQHF